MVRTKTQTDFGTWHVPGRSPLIEYSTSLLGFLASAAKNETGGAAPIAGVLFGNTDGSEIRITAHRSVDCSALADEFPLTAKGEDQIQGLVENYSAEPDLRGLVPVGWYRSRGNSGIQLSTEDLRVWNRYFPLPWQVTLVVRRHEDGTVKAGFFFRPDRGPVRTESSYRTFEVEPVAGVSPDVSRLAAAVASPPDLSTPVPPPAPRQTPASSIAPVAMAGFGASAAAAAAPALEKPAPETTKVEKLIKVAQPVSSAQAPPPPPPPAAERAAAAPPAELFAAPEPADEEAKSRSRKITIAVGIFSFAAASWMYATTPRQLENPVRDVALRFQGSPTDLRLAWNAESEVIRTARAAKLELIDGEKRSSVGIAADALRRGAWPVSNLSGAVEAHLIVETASAGTQPATVHAISQYVGSPGSGETALVSALERIRWIREQLGRSEKATASAAVPLPPPVAVATPAPQQLQPQPQQIAMAAAGKPLPPATQQQAPAPVVAPPPQQQPAPQQAAPQPQYAPPVSAAPSFSDPVPTRTPAVLPPAPAPASTAYAGPSSGKLIWTGYLPAGATLNIDGRNASTGTVNGSLPGVPVRVSVYPAEFSSGGLTVFSGSSRHQSGSVLETRSAQNGWMNTRYQFDPGRAREISLTGTPSAGGNFRQLQVRAGDRPVSVIVIDWELAR